MTELHLACLAYPITAPSTRNEFATKFNSLVARGAATGANLLLMPEYASMELAAAARASTVGAELESVCAERDFLLDLFITSARRHDVWLVPGTIPWQDEHRIRNRAPLISPGGDIEFQDKSVMTRFETESWNISPGTPPRIFETPWGNIGIAICYDCEFPTLVRTQTTQGARLILVPSCTDTFHGYNRVALSARARALENQCYVAVAPTVGAAPSLATLDDNHGHAAIFGPVDRGFPPDGIIAAGNMDEPGWTTTKIDLASLDLVREHGAVRNFRDWPQHGNPPQ